MIKSREDLAYYLKSDLYSLSRNNDSRQSIKAFLIKLFFKDEILSFQKRLRQLEFFTNQRESSKSIFNEIKLKIAYWRYRKLAVKLGFTIPPNVFGPGLSIAHYGNIVVNKHSKIGKNCRVHVGVNIGTKAGFEDKAPNIGDNVYIGPGAKIFGDIQIASNIAIGANAVVTKSFLEEGIVIGGMPAKKIGYIDTAKF